MSDDGARHELEPLALVRDGLDLVREGMQIIGFDWRYLYVNAAVARQGRKSKEELLGRTMMEVYPGIEDTDMFRVLKRCMDERAPSELENEFQFGDGQTAWFELRVQPVPQGVLVLSLDISQRKSIESQLRHAQKMEAVGRLAGGVAHDFNNVLSVVLGYTSLMLDDLHPSDPMREPADEIHQAGMRANALTRQLLAFSRHQVLEPANVNMNEVIGGMRKMIDRLAGEGIQITYRRGSKLGKTFVDPAQIEQVLMNLVVNARDAMPEGGQLTVETKNVTLDEPYADDHVEVAPGKYVLVAVTDTGIGMDRATRERIFEPFFTTKSRDHGTGLGLSTAFGIVRQSGGHIWVYSEPNQGTTFKVYLPVSTRAADEEGPAPSMDLTAAGGKETILVVEDDEQVLGLASTILRRAGYHVLEAETAGDALLTCEQYGARIHLLLTDVVLPKMSGMRLAERLATLRPEMRVLYMSGYAESAIVQHGVIDGDAAYLQKPITPNPLLRRVREVLDGDGRR